jgi:hypothetical protein
VIIVGSLLSHQAWAPKDYPMGFYQGNISKILSNAIAPIIKESNSNTNNNTTNHDPIISFDYGTDGNDNEIDPDVVIAVADNEIVYRISGATGLPVSILADGQEMLEDVSTIAGISPCRLHFHRAPTDNDKYGYSSRWEALGLDTEMVYEEIKRPSNANKKMKDVIDTHKLRYVTITRLPNRSIDGAQGFSCNWLLKPRAVDTDRLR